MDEVLLRRLLGAGALLAIALLFSALLPEPLPAGTKEGVVAYDLRTNRRIGALAPVENPPELKPDEVLRPRPAVTVPDTSPAPQPEARSATPALPRPSLKVDETLGAGGGWYVQVGSYSNAANARSAAQKLFGMGLQTAIQSVSVGQTRWYRVRVGPYLAEGTANEALARIKKGGYPDAKLVRPDPPKRN